jgi:hypothetical protein
VGHSLVSRKIENPEEVTYVPIVGVLFEDCSAFWKIAKDKNICVLQKEK